MKEHRGRGVREIPWTPGPHFASVSPHPEVPQSVAVPILQLEGIQKAFGAVQALRGVSFDLRAGEVHALLGENGAGKSTLIRIVTGAHAPDRGEIRLEGRAVRIGSPDRARALGIACVYQQPSLFPDLSVAENLALRLESAAPFRRVRWAERRRRAAGLLDRLGAGFSPDSPVSELSMPEQQLVEIASALGTGARILLFDEPTASLTRADQERLHGIVRNLRNEGVAVVYITHRLEEVFALADRVTVLRDGESIATRPVRPGAQEMDAPLTEAKLIRCMVGREIAQLYPEAGNPPGAVVLSVRDLASAEAGIREITFELRAGEILGLAGLVGAGRTELARTLFGITPADSGEIVLDGRRVRIRSPRDAVARGIAYVPEDRRRHGVVLEMPVAHNISLAVHPTLFPRGWIRPDVEADLAGRFIADLGIRTAGPGAPSGTLSGGNQQKVALSRWLATRPKVLLLDEPTQGVDIGAKAEIHRLIRRLADDGLAIVMISSDLPEILGMSDRIGVLRGGRLVSVFHRGADPSQVMAAALGRTVDAKEAA